ncbi:hypothetical protein, partial [Morganella morganii]
VTAASLRMQSGSSTDITAGSNASISASTSANLIGSSSAIVSGGGQTLTVNSGGNSGTAEFTAPNFRTPSAGLNEHIHDIAAWVNAENHGSYVEPPRQGGGSGSSESPVQPQPANDVSPELPVAQDTEAVQFVNYTSETEQVQSQDLMTSDPGMTGYSIT